VTQLLLTVRFLDDRYHGLLDRSGPPEWPPSPFRLFQALVAGVARRGELVDGDDICLCATCKVERKRRGIDTKEPDKTRFKPIGKALGWLQRHTRKHPPIIIAPESKTGQAVTRFVPNNDGDKKFDRQERLTAKHTEPTLFLLEPDQKPEVHYVWDITGDRCNAKSYKPDIERAARSLTALGWGIDMAFADARLATEDDIQKLKGIRWYPKKNAGSFRDTLRTPTYDDELGECTLCDLRHCHNTFINRIEHGKPLKTVDKPKIFDRVLYTSTERPAGRPSIVFRLLDEELSPTRYPQPLLAHIAAVVRHAAIDCMGENGCNAPRWIKLPEEKSAWVCRFVRGRKEPLSNAHQQISYVPLPSIGHEHSDAMIRNVMVVAPIECERELEYVAARLSDLPLEFKDKGEAWDTDVPPRVELPRSLQRFKPPGGKFIAKYYLGRSKAWQSVTPVILDEHIHKKVRDTRDRQKIKVRDEEGIKQLIILALKRAGIETPCEFTWQTLPFFKNCLSAHRFDRNKRPNYLLPKRLDGKTAIHLRLIFAQEVPGPVTLGAGRHCGFGLMAAVKD
jgi:CRISPR-associated protein Csb2